VEEKEPLVVVVAVLVRRQWMRWCLCVHANLRSRKLVIRRVVVHSFCIWGNEP
jgi:hypothetical protein